MATDDDMGSAPTVAGTQPSSPGGTGAGAPTLIANRYEILGLLGAGGMGRVYRAHDRSLDETIALKMLRRELVDMPGAIERFRQEVKLARRVTSPHVVRTFDFGEHGEDHFLTMEYIDGRSLAQRIDAGPLATDETLRIARAACSGIAAAHAAGVLHRDLKPDNVLIGKDRTAITDFGIARTNADPTATGEGLIGTPAYMAPEQVMGAQTLSPAVDVYAFGAILFEMLTGKRPFPGTDPIAVAVARLHQAPPDPRHVRSVPDSLAALVLRCLAREATGRFADGGELGKALDKIGDVTAVDITAQRAPIVPTKTSRSVALLPLQAADELADIASGLSEEIVDALTLTRELRIMPLASVRATIRESRDPAVVGKALNVDVIVDGSLRKRGDKVRITARAIGVTDGFQLWANHFDTAPEGLLDAGDQVARAVASALTVDIELPVRVAPNPRALELYLEGKAKLRTGWFNMGLRDAHSSLEEAHTFAPDDPNILAALAMALARTSFLTEKTHQPRARALAERAVALAPHSGEAWQALGLACLYANQQADAARALVRAVACAPGLAIAQAAVGAMALEAGALDDAIAHLEAAAALDPIHPPVADLPRAYLYTGQRDRAFEMLREAKHQRHFAQVQLARFAMWEGKLFEPLSDSTDALRALGDFARYAAILRTFHATGDFAPGEREEFDAIISRGGPRMRTTLSQFMAEHLMFAGDVDGALRYVKQSVDTGLIDTTWMQRCPMLAPLRDKPEFQLLAQTVASRAQAVLAAAGASRLG